MSVCPAVFAQIVASKGCRCRSRCQTSKYLELFADFDEFWSSPEPAISKASCGYISLYVLQNANKQNENGKRKKYVPGGLREFDALELLSDAVVAESGFN